MQLKQSLMWLKGRRIIVCDPDLGRLDRLRQFFKGFGLEVVALSTAKQVTAEIEKHHYSTRRVYLAVLIDQSLAQAVVKVWGQVTHDNPTILSTPVVLMRQASDLPQLQTLLEKGYFKYQLDQPPSSRGLLRLLIRLNRWKKWQKELSSRPRPSVFLKR